jgi:IclR family acetate operon transcriptional repressor
MVERARPHLRRLMEATEETEPWVAGCGRLFLSQSKPTTPFARFPPGTLSPHASGIGKALLAQWPQNGLMPCWPRAH